MPIDPLGSGTGLDPRVPVAGLDPLTADPNAPGAFRRGLGAGVAGVKASLYGAGALAAHGAAAVLPDSVAPAAATLEQSALANAQQQSDLAAAQSMQFEDVVNDPTRAGEYFKFLLGNAVPSLATMLAGGVIGRGIGALVGRGLAPAAAATAKTIGMNVGAVAPDVALEAGGIYPEAVKNHVEDPGTRALLGGAGAAAFDFVPLLAAEKYIKPVGKGGLGAMLKGAAKGAPVGAALEGSQELIQSVIERASAGDSLTDPAAISDYINSFLGGAAPGSIFGAGIGGHRQAAAPVATAPPATAPPAAPPASAAPTTPPGGEPPSGGGGPTYPKVDSDGRAYRTFESGGLVYAGETNGNGYPDRLYPPTPEFAAHADLSARHAAATEQLAALEPAVAQAQQDHDALVARRAALDDEAKLELGQRRTKSAITVEKRAVTEQVKAAKAKIEELGGQVFGARSAIDELAPQVEAAAKAIKPAPVEGAVPDLVAPQITPRADPLVSDTIADPNVPAPTEAEHIDRAVKGVHAMFREQGMPLTTTEESFATPAQTPREVALAKVEERTPREKVPQANPAQMAAVEENAMTVIEPLAREIAKSKSDTPGGQAKITANLTETIRGVVQEAAKLGSVEEAQQHVVDKLPAALKGHGVKVDAEDIAKAVSAGVGLAKTQYSKGATDLDGLPLIEHIDRRLKQIDRAGQAERRQVSIETYGHQTKTPEFKKWFGDTGVADTTGKPVVAYHGTSQDITAFKPSRDGRYGPGIYFWDSPERASSWAEGVTKNGPGGDMRKAGGAANVIPVYLRNASRINGGWMVHKATDVKSAIGNIGAFDPKNPDITASRAALTQDAFDALPPAAQFAATNAYNAVMRERGTALRDRLAQLIGERAELQVLTYSAKPGGPIGSYMRLTPLKSVISLALNAKDGLGVADHEGYHYAEDWLLTGAEKRIVANALKSGKPAFEQLKTKLQQYDRENQTNLTDEVTGTPAEARAYAFEFWRRGQLQAEGALARIWQKLQQFLERVGNAVKGLGFKSMEDVFRALDLGQMAQREAVFDDGDIGMRNSNAASIKAAPGVDMIRMAKLLGPQLYGNMSDIGVVTIKEMFQNSFDALKGALAKGHTGSANIAITLDSDARTITLVDNGTGMTPETINKAFLTLAGTEKETDRASGGLGIAKMLFLFGNKRLSLVTVRNGVESTLDTSGAQLMASFSDPTKAPDIHTREVSAPSGTTITVEIPETYHDEADDSDKAVRFPSRYDAENMLVESPLFEPIDVTLNDSPVAIGKEFPIDEYTVLTVAKFAWGKVRVMAAETQYAPYNNVSILSNGLYQFSSKITKDPTDAWAGSAPYKFFFNLEPDVSADSPNYPIALNRKGYSQSAKADIDALTSYINALYANKVDEAGSSSFGLLKQVDVGGTGTARYIDLNVPPAKKGTVLSLDKNDKVEVRDGRLFVNNREMPELTKETLKEMRRDPTQFRVDQSLLDPEQLIIHDNVLLDGKPYLEEAAKELGAADLNGYLRSIGSVFKSVRDAVAREGGDDYTDVLQVPVGVSLDIEYYGVNTNIPFKAMMVNPALVRDSNPDTAPLRMVSTMIHELAHHKQKNHSETGFIPELQRLGVVLAVSGDTQKIVIELRRVLEKYSHVLDYFVRTSRNGNLTNRGIRLEGDSEAATGEGVPGGASGASRTGRDESDIPGVRRPVTAGSEAGPQGDQRSGALGATAPVRLFSKAAIEMNTRMENGELELTQEFRENARMVDSAMTHTNDTLKRVMLGPLAQDIKGTVSRWWMENISTPNYIASFSNGYKNMMHTLNTYIRYRETLIERMLREQIPEWYKAAFIDQDAAFDALLKRTVSNYKTTSQEYQDLYRALTPAQQRLFDSANKMIASFLDAELAVDTKDYKRLLTSPGTYDKWLADRTAQVQELKANGYIPLRRYGDHTVRVYKQINGKDGKPQQLEVRMEMFQTERHAIMASEIYKDEFQRQGAPYTVEVGFKHKTARDTTISVQQYLDTARRNGVEISATERERLVLALSASDSMVRNRMLRREGMPGFSKDGMRVLNEFGVNMSGKIAYSRFGVALDAAADGRKVDTDVVNGEPVIQIDELRYDAEGKQETAAEFEARNIWALDGPKSGYYRNMADELSDYVLAPDHTGEWSRKLRGAAMMYFIGGSISAGMVNTMSVPMLLVPQLSVHTNYVNGLAAAMGAWKTTWQHQAILRDITRLKNLDHDPNNVIPGMSDELRAALVAAADKLMDTELHQIMAISQGTFFSQSRRVQKAMDVWMAPFRVSEQTNRITSFIAAYNVGKGNGLKDQALFNFARDMVDSTQNNYSAANRPGAARSPVFAMAFMFKSFPLFMTEAIMLMYKANPKSAVFMLLGLTMMTGVQGLPFAETLLDLIDTISQRVFGSPFNSRRAMRNVIKSASEAITGYDASDLVLRGMMNEIAGMSVASRIGAGDFVPGSRLGTADADEGRILSQFAGAPYAMVKDVGSNVGKLVGGALTGDWKQAADALRAGGPIAARNAIKGAEQFSDGYASDSKGRKIVDVSTPAALWQMSGVSSAAVARMYDMENINVQTKAFYTQVSEDMQAQLVAAMRANDTAKVQEINDLRNAWNAQYPEMPIIPNAAATRRAIILSGVPLDKRSQMLWSRRLRGANVFSEESE